MQQFQFLQKCEFSLTNRAKDFPGQIVARLSIPAGVSRIEIREFIQTSSFTILRQQCIGDENQTTGWSKLYFQTNVTNYQQLQQLCLTSNLKSVRDATTNLMTQLQATETVECEPTFSVEQLMECSLNKLRQIAKLLKIENRSKLTKNLATARQELIPLIVGLPIPEALA
jgi:hypothetical protein